MFNAQTANALLAEGAKFVTRALLSRGTTPGTPGGEG